MLCRESVLTLENLLAKSNQVIRLLGKKVQITKYNAKDFRKEIGYYVDSNNKGVSSMQYMRCWRMKMCHIEVCALLDATTC